MQPFAANQTEIPQRLISRGPVLSKGLLLNPESLQKSSASCFSCHHVTSFFLFLLELSRPLPADSELLFSKGQRVIDSSCVLRLLMSPVKQTHAFLSVTVMRDSEDRSFPLMREYTFVSSFLPPPQL